MCFAAVSALKQNLAVLGVSMAISGCACIISLRSLISENDAHGLTLYLQTVQDQISIVVVQILAKIMSSQNEDGSWGPQNSVDSTTYALPTLITIINLPYLQILSVEAQYAIERSSGVISDV